MATQMKQTDTAPNLLADIQAIADALASRKPVDAEIARRVRERAAKARQDLLATHGVQDIGVQIIREIRGNTPEP